MHHDVKQAIDLRARRSSSFAPIHASPREYAMAAVQFVVEGERPLTGTIRPSGNKNAALPIICAALISDQPVTLHNVPRIRDVETLLDLVRSLDVKAEWRGPNTLELHAKTVRAAAIDRALSAKIRASILLRSVERRVGKECSYRSWQEERRKKEKKKYKN